MRKVAVRTRSIPRRSFTPELLVSLHALACRMLSQDGEHFRIHAETNEVVHVYERTDTGSRSTLPRTASPRSTRLHPSQPGVARQWLQCRGLVSLHAGEPGQARVGDCTQAMTAVPGQIVKAQFS